MLRFAIALITLALPLAATPAFACGMPADMEDGMQLTDLLDSIDDAGDDVAQAAAEAVAGIGDLVLEVLPAPPVAPPTPAPAERTET